MTNHVHLIAVPRRADALAVAIGRAHQRHSLRINRAHGWQGHLWAARFHSTPLDEEHLWAAIKYVELNSVRAGLVGRAQEWPWSSARLHAGLKAPEAAGLPAAGCPFGGTRPHPLTGRPIGWRAWLALGLEAEALERLRRTTMTGRPCGSEAFARRLEKRLGRRLREQKRGRKPSSLAEAEK
jgi:putative transposase